VVNPAFSVVPRIRNGTIPHIAIGDVEPDLRFRPP
jgi:hypothetical protein